METLNAEFGRVCTVWSDIYQHCPVLAKYAEECGTVLEAGVRSGNSSWALLYGLSKSSQYNKLMISVDTDNVLNLKLIDTAHQVGIKHKFLQQSILDFQTLGQEFDLVFIDTFHVFGQMKRELNLLAGITKKYIIMHDTTVDEYQGELIRNGWKVEDFKHLGWREEELRMGIWPAIVNFLSEHPEWVVKERLTNNNGLTVLARC